MRCAIVSSLLTLLLTVTLSAQFDTATVLGTVRDQQSAAVGNANVSLRNIDTNLSSSTLTNPDGSYQLAAVQIGRYEVVVNADRFRQGKSEQFQLTVGARQRVDFELVLASVETTVDVVAEASLLESDSSDRSQVVNSKQIVELPLNGRAYSELVFLTPGSVPSPSSGNNFNDREGAFVANGLRSVYNNYMLDGLDNNYYGTSNQGFSNQVTQLTPDAVAEFRVVTNNMSAEYGRSGGAVVNVAMRSGTNEFHGSAWWFLRNTQLNAVGFFKPVSGEKPRLNRNQYGFAVGGPVVKNRMFFFTDFEGYREVESTVQFATIPNEQARAGILGIPVVDPTNGRLFLNGVIPQSAMIPFARQVLSQLPATTSTSLANNYQRLVRVENFRDKGDAKLDYNFNDATRFFLRYTQSRADIFDPGTIPGVIGGDGNGFTQIPVRQIASGLTWALDPSSILEFRVGHSSSEAGKRPPLSGGPSMQELFGIPGLPTDPQFTGGMTYQAFVGFTALGRQFTNPQYQHPDVWNPKVNFTKILDRHTLKAGGEFQFVAVEQLDLHPVYGLNAYQGLFSGTPFAVTSQTAPLYSLADFMFGAPAVLVQSSVRVANIRQNLFFTYLQDDIKINRKLTVNLGLRYEFSTPILERDNAIGNFNPETNQIERALNDGSLRSRGLVNPDLNNFAPRIGAAYSLSANTVLRGGYGISYSHFNRVGSSYLTLNPPFAIVSQQFNIPGTPTFRNTQQGYPDGFVSPAAFSPLRSVVQHMPEESPTARVQSWFFSIQQNLGGDWLVDLAYVGNSAKNLPLVNDINQARVGSPAGQFIPVQFRRPNQAFGSIPGILPIGFSGYHGLQAKAEKRFGGGLYLLNSFTWSKVIDNGTQALDGGPDNNGVPSVQDIYNIDADRGISAYDRTLVNVSSVVYEVPFGRGRRFGSDANPFVEGLFGGWQVTAINNMRGGTPVTLGYVPSLAAEVSPVITVLGRNMYRPNVVRNPLVPESERTHLNYLDRSAVTIPSQTNPFGNAGRNIVRSPALFQLDLGVHKAFPIREEIELQFRAEAFNALNRTNFGLPSGDASSPAFGSINSAFDPRQFQFALKLLF